MPRDETYLYFMLMAARRITAYIGEMKQSEFDSDPKTRDAVVLQIGNIGEAASKISETFRNQHPNLPWAQMIGMRHRVFHGYEVLDWSRIWATALKFVPELIPMLETLVPPEENM
ncbi:DUF86 domain-containing protein [candidate division KSB1 bacterium]|nr:MAG: DUF86 domain-containing protein [candidate division KSB1 bacterium]